MRRILIASLVQTVNSFKGTNMSTLDPRVLPDQAISYAEKAADDYKVMKTAAKYYKGLAKFPNLDHLYAHANGTYFNKQEYSHLTNPYGLDATKPLEANLLNKGTVAEIRNMPIIMPMVNLHMGEKRRRKRQFTVTTVNSDAKSRQRAAVMSAIMPQAQQQFVNNVNQLGMETGVPTKPVPDFVEQVDTVVKNYVDERAIVGQQAVSILEDELELASKEFKKFYHYVASGYTLSYKTVEDDEVVYDVVDPRHFWYLASDDIDVVENTEAQVRRIPKQSVNDILKRFQKSKDFEKIKKKLKDKVANADGEFYEATGDVHTGGTFPESSFKTDYGHKRYDVYHIVWKSLSKQGKLTYTNKLGMEDIMTVDDSYKLDKDNGDISLEWVLQDEYWECWHISCEEDLFVDCQPLEIQRPKFNGKGAKSCYNGKAFSDLGAENTSIVKIGIPFQKKVNEYHYYLDRTMGKNNDKIILMDKNAIPNNGALSEIEAMYYAKEHGFMFVDMQQKGAGKFNNWQVLDATYTQYVLTAFELIARWTELYHQAIGVNRQRTADVKASDGKATTQDALNASYTMSEELFAKFDDCELKDMQGLLDISKFAWREGKSRVFKGSDGRDVFFEIDPEDYQEAEYQVYIKNGNAERENLTTYRGLMMSLIQNSGQNGADPGLFAKIINAESMSVIEKLTAEFMELQKKIMAEQQKAAADGQAALSAKEDERVAAELANKVQLKQMDIDGRKEEILLQNQATLASAPIPADTSASMVQKILADREKAVSANNIALQKLDEDRNKRVEGTALKSRELDIKEKQIEAQRYVAKVNKN